jgi:hypothetical protein
VSTLSAARVRRRAGDEGLRLRIRLARLESDLAYFQARLEIIGDPTTTNQRAQRKAFKLLHRTIGDRVLRLRRRLVQSEQPQAL